MRDRPRLVLALVLIVASGAVAAASGGPRLVPGTQVPIWTDGGLPLAQRPPPGTDLSTIGQRPVRGWRHDGPRGHHGRPRDPHGLAPHRIDRRGHRGDVPRNDGRIVDCVPRTARVIVITDRPRCAREPERRSEPVRVSRETLDRLRD